MENLHRKLVNQDYTAFRGEVEAISKMEKFREEISQVSKEKGIINFADKFDAWTKFMSLYAHVIEDCPLEITSESELNIEKVTVTVEIAKEIKDGQRFFKLSWHIFDRSNGHGEVTIYNSYSVAD